MKVITETIKVMRSNRAGVCSTDGCESEIASGDEIGCTPLGRKRYRIRCRSCVDDLIRAGAENYGRYVLVLASQLEASRSPRSVA